MLAGHAITVCSQLSAKRIWEFKQTVLWRTFQFYFTTWQACHVETSYALWLNVMTVTCRDVDPICFSGSGPTHFLGAGRWVRIGIGPTHFLRWIVYYCVCIQHDIDKSQISFTELCKSLRTNSGLSAINMQLSTFILTPIMKQKYLRCFLYVCVLWQQNLKFPFHQKTVEIGPTNIFYTDLRPWLRGQSCEGRSNSFDPVYIK